MRFESGCTDPITMIHSAVIRAERASRGQQLIQARKHADSRRVMAGKELSKSEEAIGGCREGSYPARG